MNMDSIIIDTIKHLYNEKQLTIDSLEKCKQWLENKYGITDQIELAPALYNFKTEILDYLLINLSQLTDIEEIKAVYQRLEDIQELLAMEFEEA